MRLTPRTNRILYSYPGCGSVIFNDRRAGTEPEALSAEVREKTSFRCRISIDQRRMFKKNVGWHHQACQIYVHAKDCRGVQIAEHGNCIRDQIKGGKHIRLKAVWVVHSAVGASGTQPRHHGFTALALPRAGSRSRGRPGQQNGAGHESRCRPELGPEPAGEDTGRGAEEGRRCRRRGSSRRRRDTRRYCMLSDFDSGARRRADYNI
jgi:hypothetical protein